MITADCDSVRDDLDAYADGELRGGDLRRVARHLEGCRRCLEEVEVRRALGLLIRQAVPRRDTAAVPAGLASGVVARVTAEWALSWRAVMHRAVEDWHWVIVGGGAVGATFVSMLFCAALLVFGTAAPREDSLSSLINNLRNSPGEMYAEVSRRGANGEVMLVQLETSGARSGVLPEVLLRNTEEQGLVTALAQVLPPHRPLGAMSESERRHAEWLLDNIARLRSVEPTSGPLTMLTVHRLHLVTNTEVVAKGLTP